MNDVLRILFLTQIIVIGLFFLIRYMKYNSLPDCSLQTDLHHLFQQQNMFIREYFIRSFHKLDNLEQIHKKLLQNSDMIANVLDSLYPGTYYETKGFLLTNSTLVEQMVDNKKDREEIDNNLKKLSTHISTMNRQFDVSVLQDKLLKWRLLTDAQLRSLTASQTSVNEYDAIAIHTRDLTNYLIDPPKRWPTTWISG